MRLQSTLPRRTAASAAAFHLCNTPDKFSTLSLPSATESLVLFLSDKGRPELGSRLDASIS